MQGTRRGLAPQPQETTEGSFPVFPVTAGAKPITMGWSNGPSKRADRDLFKNRFLTAKPPIRT